MLTYYDQLSVQVMMDEVSRRIMFAAKQIHIEVCHEKNPGWLGYIADYTTQLYRDYNKPL